MKAIIRLTITIPAFLGLFFSSCSHQPVNTMRFFIGSYSTAEEPGIYSCEVNLKDKKMKVLSATFGIENPSFLALSPNEKFLYAVSETNTFDDSGSGGVYAFQVKAANLELREINSTGSSGAHPCHVSVHPNGKFLFVANYSGGSICSISLNPDGSLNEKVQAVQHMGSGPVSGRQEKAHAHSANVSPSGNFLYAADLGIDKMMGYQLNAQSGELIPADQATLSLAPGAGPRHMAFMPDGKTAFVINELNSTITTCRINPDSGQLDTLSSVSTLPGRFNGENYCADIHVHPSGEFVYASNRGHNSIAVFKVVNDSKNDLALEMVQTAPVIGDWPRNFAISHDGKYLLVANQRSNNIVLLEINPESGWLKDIGLMAQIPNPVCIVFCQ